MKTTIEKTKMTIMMITATALIGTLGIGAQSAFADTIDFETDAELDDVGNVVTATNTVTFKVDDSSDPNLSVLPDGVVVTTGADTYGFSGTSADGVSGQSGVNSLSNNIAKESAEGPGIGNWNAFDYVLLFDSGVSNLSLDVYDFGDYPSVQAAGSITLNVYSDAAATVLVGSDSVDTSAAGNDSTVTLSVGSPSAPVLSAKVVDSKGDVGTAIDNVTFETAEFQKISDCEGEVFTQKDTQTQTCSFTIYPGFGDTTDTILDTVPAEWEVANVGALEALGCTVDTKKSGKSATKLECPVDQGPIVVDVETRESPGKGHTKNGDPAFKPTFCGILSLNDGAIRIDDSIPPNIVDTTESLLLLVSEGGNDQNDCDADGFIDALEFEKGTNPADDTDFPACGGINTVDFCLDGDGIATAQRGTFSAVWGDSLTTWPAPGDASAEGLDWFDLDANNVWTVNTDALHLERTTTCLTGIPNATYDLGLDCVLLDMGSNLVGGESVDCDLDNGFSCAPNLVYLSSTGMKFVDGESILDGFYNNGEDIIIDVDGNGIFN
jgi:hypothetical protein